MTIPMLFSEINTSLSPKEKSELLNFQLGIQKLEEAGAIQLYQIFTQHNLFKKNRPDSTTKIIRELKVKPCYTALLKAHLEILVRHGYPKKHTAPKAQLARLFANITQTYPNLQDFSLFLQNVFQSYLKVIQGKEGFLNIMFPKGSFHIIEKLYKKNPLANLYNRFLCSILKIYAHQKNLTALDIIEVGAGIGSSSEIVLADLAKKDLCAHYIYTDISKAFTRYGAENFGKKYSFMSFAALDLEIAVEHQNIPRKKYDVIIATNALHTTKNILDTLMNIKKLLKPGGLLLVNEGVFKRDFSTLAYGFSEGWWTFEDKKKRIPNSPLLTTKRWKALLKKAGFGSIHSINETFYKEQSLFQDIIAGIHPL